MSSESPKVSGLSNATVGLIIVVGGLLVLAGLVDYIGVHYSFIDSIWPFILVFAGLAFMGGEGHHHLMGVVLLVASLFIMAIKYGSILTDGSRLFLGVAVILVGILFVVSIAKPKS